MKVITAIVLLSASALSGYGAVKGLEYVEQVGYERGVKASPPTNCYPFLKEAKETAESQVQMAASLAYQVGAAQTVQAVQAYILDACVNEQEFTVADEQFVCLKKQEM